MPGSAIGISMLFGYPGSYARNGDCIIRNRLIKSTDEAGPAFGDPVVLNTDNTYSKFGADNVAADFAGVAVREVQQALDYIPASGSYSPGYPCDIIERGAVSVVCNVGTPTSGGAVYVRVTANAAIPAGVVGGFEAAADGDNTVQLTNCQWAGNSKDANNVAELTILTRNKA